MSAAAGSRWNVIADHEPTYAAPIAVCTGEAVTLGDRDSEYPGWIWCVSASGSSGWVPEAYLDLAGRAGVARRDYDAVELRVHAGEQVTCTDEECGWVWARNAAGQEGWVPKSKLLPAE